MNGCRVFRARATLLSVLLAPLLTVAMVLSGCGGGYGSSNSMAKPNTMVSVGTVTHFSATAMTVNGTQFQMTAATVRIEGQPGRESDLSAGDVVQVKSHHDAGSGEDIADEVDFRAAVQGPVTSIDTTTQTLIVLGQTVVLSATTSFDDQISPASIAGIKVGDILEVSGMTAADGSIQATRIELKPAGAPFHVVGTASATDGNAKTLQINALTVDFANATLSDFPSTGPADGDLIEASGTTLESSGALQAQQLERLSNPMAPGEDEGAHIEGLITRFASASDFDVAGHPVSTSAATQFENGTAADLALNVRVEVEGALDSQGVIQASKVEIEQASDVRLIGQVDQVDATGGTLTVLGTQITVSAMTRFEDESSAQMQTFDLSAVQVGDWVAVRGTVSGTGVAAQRIDRLQPQPQVSIAGPVTAAASPSFTVVATPVMTNATTQFANGLDATSFFNGLVGKTAEARGSWDGTTLTATDVQIGGQDDGGDGD